jgi:hypothetical protein
MANRTLPDRLSDVQNVKDWGAVGLDGAWPGAHDDAPHIQSAINYCIDHGGGTVFFPPGEYQLGAALVIGTSDPAKRNNIVRLVGSGREATTLTFNSVPWPCVSKGASNTWECIESIEDMGIGSIQLVGSNIFLSSLTVYSDNAVDLTNANGVYVTCCHGVGSIYASNYATSGPGYGQGFAPQGTVGIALGNACLVYDSFFEGVDIAFALSGTGAACISCRGDTSNIGFRVGWGIVGGVGAEKLAIGCTLQSPRVIIARPCPRTVTSAAARRRSDQA